MGLLNIALKYSLKKIAFGFEFKPNEMILDLELFVLSNMNFLNQVLSDAFFILVNAYFVNFGLKVDYSLGEESV